MFSQRLPWHLPANRLSQLLAEKRRAGRPILDLTLSNPTVALPELYSDGVAPLRAAMQRLCDPAGLRYQPSAGGDTAARQAVASYYAERQLAVSAEQLVLCASTSEAYSWLFALLCQPGEQVLFPQPSYPLLEFLGRLAGVETRPYPLYFDRNQRRWRIDFPALRAQLLPTTRALVVVSPNNPTGSLLQADEHDELLAICQESQLALIVDEVFADYRLDPATAGLPSLLPSLGSDPSAYRGPLRFVLSGLSKVVGLPQLKLGWIAVGGPEPLRSAAQSRLEILADTFLSVGTPIQLATPALLAAAVRQPIQAAIRQRLGRNLQALRDALPGSPIELLPVEGGWYAVLRLPQLCSEEEWVLTLLGDDDLLCHPGYFYDFAKEAYIVVSLLGPEDELRQGVQRLLCRTTRLEKVS